MQFAAFALYLHRRRHYRDVAPFAHFEAPHWHTIFALLRLGVPMGISVLMEAGLFVAAALLIGSLGAVPVAGHQVAINVAATANSASSHIRKRGGATDAATASSIVTVLSIGRSGAARRISARMPSAALAGVAVRATNATNRTNPLRSCWNGA